MLFILKFLKIKCVIIVKQFFALNKKCFNVNLNKFIIWNLLIFILIFEIFKMIISYKILIILHF